MGPLMMGRLDLAMRAHFRSQGHGFFKINRLMEGFNPNTIQMAVAEADCTTPGVANAFDDLIGTEAKIGAPRPQGEPGSTGAIGDGSFLQNFIAAIKAFAASDFGKALIAAIEKALLGFLIP